MKKVYIIHRWSGNPKGDWYPWLKKQLEKKEFEVIVPEMPHAEEPKINEWVSYLKEVVKNPEKNTYFVGHSIGCQTIMRYLESLPANTKIANVVFVAGWFKLDNLEDEEMEAIAKPWTETPINFNKVKQKINKIVVFLSDNEPYGFVEENAKIFKNKLGAKVVIENNKGHFTKEDNILKLSEILKEI